MMGYYNNDNTDTAADADADDSDAYAEFVAYTYTALIRAIYCFRLPLLTFAVIIDPATWNC